MFTTSYWWVKGIVGSWNWNIWDFYGMTFSKWFMRAINDFSAYEILYGLSTHGQLACSTCIKKQKALSLKNGGKFSWFDYH